MRRAIAPVLALLAGCAPAHTTSAIPSDSSIVPAVDLQSPASAFPTPIRHVVVIIQENRSFDNIFAGYPNANAPTYGYEHNGTKIALGTVAYSSPTDVAHTWASAMTDYAGGKMDGFDLEQISGSRPAGTFPYAHLPRSEVVPYWTLAQQYELADNFFPTMFGGSFTAHLDLIAGTANLSPTQSLVDTPSAEPWGCDAPAGTTTMVLSSLGKESTGPYPCFTQFATMANSLDAHAVSWKYYVANATWIWNAFDAVSKIRNGADWSGNIVTPQTAILTDPAKGKLADVTWVTPDWADSDHPAGGDTGPSWVANVVNAIGKSPYWKSTAIVVLWDDWGGWYDNATPPKMDFRGLGIRVPCIVISPYAKHGTVVHTQYEFGSVLRMVEQVFNLPALGSPSAGYTDSRATSLIDALDFSQPPRTFVPVAVRYPAQYFFDRPPSNHVLDEQ